MSRFLKYALVSTVLLTSLCNGRSVNASFSKPATKSTCLDLHVKFPSGIARDKKATGLRQYPKAKVDKTIYAANRTWDWLGNRNGIVCDKNEKPGWGITARVIQAFGGVNVEVGVRCYIYDVTLDPGFEVGYANIYFGSKCTIEYKNIDNFYSFNPYQLDCCSIYFAFDSTVTNSYNNMNSIAFAETGFRGSYISVDKGKSVEQSNNNRNLINGKRNEIELLYQRILNGLYPDLYFGLEYSSWDGSDFLEKCYAIVSNPNPQPTKEVASSKYCYKAGSDILHIWE